MLEAQLQALFELYGEKMVQDMRTKMAERTKTYRSVARDYLDVLVKEIKVMELRR